jgi:dTDP-glucose 4,6-dehydratase
MRLRLVVETGTLGATYCIGARQHRPGHDDRYEIDPTRAEAALDRRAAHDFERGPSAGICTTGPWWVGIRAQTYHEQRLG